VLSDEKIIENPKRLFEYVKIINDQNNRLAKNVEKVLNLASLEKNKLQLVLEKTELSAFVEKTVKRFRQSELGMNAKITVRDILPEEFIRADQFHFGNVIQNILENAVKYCKKTPEIEISLQKKRKSIYLKIKDNGIGIPREDRKRIFRKFYRISTGNIHDVKGFGLGLDYVSTIIKAHHWGIFVDGNIEGGSIFNIVIPDKNE